ncbi:ATPase family AAA domain-containing protein 5b, partial [Aplochiton taeniatus]
MKQPRESGGPAKDNCEKPSQKSPAELRRSLGCLPKDDIFDDVLWTQKYSPRHSSEVISNSNSVKKLHTWLKKWKSKADCEGRQQQVEMKRDANSNDSWDCGDFQGEARSEEPELEHLCNGILITGPSGVGKTASVYACALELGFKVFEVNASSQRSGRHLLTQLQEATQSHLVESQGNNNTLKPAYLTNYTSSAIKPDPLPGKAVSLKKAVSTTKKRYRQKPNGCNHGRKSNPAAITLANFWKMKCKAESLHLDLPSENAEPQTSAVPPPGTDKLSTLAQNKKIATSLILFEEVDIIFDDDVGFLAAIKTFMATTKRPVIMTTNDPSFRATFGSHLEEIVFKTPTLANVCSYLQLLCLTEKLRADLSDITCLLRLTQGDVRRSLLQLQLWGRSGGGQPTWRAARLQGPVGVYG